MKRFWKSPALAGGLIVLLSVVAYLPAMRAGFIWDDDTYVTENQFVQAKDGLFRAWFTREPPDYYPLTWSVLWLEWRCWGNHAAGYHAVNVLLHAVNAVLVWMILSRLRIPGAWLAGLVFAIHPVTAATVAWISEQKNTLSMLLSALAVLLYLRFDEQGRRRWYLLSLTAFLLALLSKTAVVMLPFVLLGCAWWRRGRITRTEFLSSVPFITLSLVLGLVTIWFQHTRVLEGHSVRTANFPLRLAAAGWVPWFYLYKAFAPFNLSVIYPQWNIRAFHAISYVPGIILLGCPFFFWWKRGSWGRPWFFALGYFVVVLFPVLGFFDQGFYAYSLVADHWQYVALPAPIALAASGAMALFLRTGKWGRFVLAIACTVALTVLGMSTWSRAQVYRDSETLWRDTLAKNPGAWVAHENLGSVLTGQGRFAEAVTEYMAALRIKPDDAEAHYNIGNAMVSQGKIPEAMAEYTAALQIRPDFAEAHSNLGAALAHQRKIPEAMAEYTAALRIKPDYPDAHYNLGVAMASQGRIPEAVAEYRKTLYLRPDWPPALSKLAWILATDGNETLRNASEAVPLAERLCAVTGSERADALDVLAAAYAEAGRFSDAIRVAQRAVELASAAGQTELVQQVQERLKLYQAGRPFHEELPEP